MKKLLLFNMLVMLPVFGGIKAQTLEVVSGGGGYTESAAGSLSYTVGEVMIQTYEGASDHLTQGFQQSDIYVLGVQNYDLDFSISVFPNPTVDLVNIASNKKTNLVIYDASGKQVHNQTLSETDQVSMGMFSEGIYHLVFYDGTKMLKSVKVVVQ